VGQGIELLNDLINRVDDDIIIMPGGGMKPEFIKPLNINGRLKEIHSSCRKRGEPENPSIRKRSLIDESLIAQFKKAIAEC